MSQPAGQYFIRLGTQLLGPLTLEQLRNLKERGRLQPFHSVSVDGKTWQPASSLTELFPPVTVQEVTSTSGQQSLGSPTAPVQQESWFYLDSNGQQQGPVSRQALIELFQNGRLNSHAYVWKPGMDQWQPLSEVLPLSSKQPGAITSQGVFNTRNMRSFILILAISLIVESVLVLASGLVSVVAEDQVQPALFPGRFPDRSGTWLAATLPVIEISIALCCLLEAAMVYLAASTTKASAAFPMGVAAAALMVVGVVLFLPVFLVLASGVANQTIFVLLGISLLVGATGRFLTLLFLRLISSSAGLAKEFAYQAFMYVISTIVLIIGAIFWEGGGAENSAALLILGEVLCLVGALGWFAVIVWAVVNLFRLAAWLRGT